MTHKRQKKHFQKLENDKKKKCLGILYHESDKRLARTDILDEMSKDDTSLCCLVGLCRVLLTEDQTLSTGMTVRIPREQTCKQNWSRTVTGSSPESSKLTSLGEIACKFNFQRDDIFSTDGALVVI